MHNEPSPARRGSPRRARVHQRRPQPTLLGRVASGAWSTLAGAWPVKRAWTAARRLLLAPPQHSRPRHCRPGAFPEQPGMTRRQCAGSDLRRHVPGTGRDRPRLACRRTSVDPRFPHRRGWPRPDRALEAPKRFVPRTGGDRALGRFAPPWRRASPRDPDRGPRRPTPAGTARPDCAIPNRRRRWLEPRLHLGASAESSGILLATHSARSIIPDQPSGRRVGGRVEATRPATYRPRSLVCRHDAVSMSRFCSAVPVLPPACRALAGPASPLPAARSSRGLRAAGCTRSAPPRRWRPRQAVRVPLDRSQASAARRSPYSSRS